MKLIKEAIVNKNKIYFHEKSILRK